MTKTFGDKTVGDKSQYSCVGAKADPMMQRDPVVKGKPVVMNPTGIPTRFLQKRPGQ